MSINIVDSVCDKHQQCRGCTLHNAVLFLNKAINYSAFNCISMFQPLFSSCVKIRVQVIMLRTDSGICLSRFQVVLKLLKQIGLLHLVQIVNVQLDIWHFLELLKSESFALKKFG